MSDKTVFDKIEVSMTDLFQGIQKYHGEYFVSGLFIGLTKPAFGWALLGLITALPTVVMLKHPEWFKRVNDEKTEHVLLFILLIIASDLYAFNCLKMALGLNWP